MPKTKDLYLMMQLPSDKYSSRSGRMVALKYETDQNVTEAWKLLSIPDIFEVYATRSEYFHYYFYYSLFDYSYLYYYLFIIPFSRPHYSNYAFVTG